MLVLSGGIPNTSVRKLLTFDTMYVHTIDKETHADFLAQERVDPVTGEHLQSGDKVVFCAGCRSAFLLDSWAYLENRHCQQTQTLRAFPEKESLMLSYKNYAFGNFTLDRLLYTTKQTGPFGVGFLWIPVYTLIALVFGTLIAISLINSSNIGVLLMILPMMAVAYPFVQETLMPFIYEPLHIYNNGLRVDSKYFSMDEDWVLSFKDIRKIRFYQKRWLWQTISYIEVTRKDGEIRKAQAIKPFTDPKKLFWMLGRISHFVPVEFDLIRRQDRGYVRFLKDRYDTDFTLLS